MHSVEWSQTARYQRKLGIVIIDISNQRNPLIRMEEHRTETLGAVCSSQHAHFAQYQPWSMDACCQMVEVVLTVD